MKKIFINGYIFLHILQKNQQDAGKLKITIDIFL